MRWIVFEKLERIFGITYICETELFGFFPHFYTPVSFRLDQLVQMKNNNNLLMSVYIREADVSESKEISQVIINTLISSSAQYYSEVCFTKFIKL